MSDNNSRWAPHLLSGFELPQPARPAQQAQEEVDRSWLPKPSSAPGNVNWWKNGGAAREWKGALTWAERSEPAFFAQLKSAEDTLIGLERTVGSHEPRVSKARYEVAKYYAQLGRIFDQDIKRRAKVEPFVRY